MVMKNKAARIVIFSGGSLGPWALREVKPGDVLVGADRGALFLIRQQLVPDLAIGDFDSVSEDEKAEIRRVSRQFREFDPVDKNWTDTETAFDWALRQEPAEIVLLGALGTRFDHSLANIHLLRKGLDRGIPCKIVDAHNEIMLIDRHLRLTKGNYSHVSLLPLTMKVTGITLRGFRYPLHNATLHLGQSLGISNLLAGEKGDISVKEGFLLVILSREET
jgi:thiamine pyrophosphokinase